jgi:hypothetical protein
MSYEPSRLLPLVVSFLVTLNAAVISLSLSLSLLEYQTHAVTLSHILLVVAAQQLNQLDQAHFQACEVITDSQRLIFFGFSDGSL